MYRCPHVSSAQTGLRLLRELEPPTVLGQRLKRSQGFGATEQVEHHSGRVRALAVLRMSGSLKRSRKRRVKSTARVHANVNLEKPKEYWDYDNLQLHWK